MYTLNDRDVYHDRISSLLALDKAHTLYTVVFVTFIDPKTKREEGVLHVYDNRLNVLECDIPLDTGAITKDFYDYYYYIMRVPHVLIIDTSEYTTTENHLPLVEKYNPEAIYTYDRNDWGSYLKERKGLSRILGNSPITDKVLATQTLKAFTEIVVHQGKVPNFDDAVTYVNCMEQRLLTYLPLSNLPAVYVYGVKESTLVNLYNVLTGEVDVRGKKTDVHEKFLKEALRTDVLHSKVNRSDFGRVLVGSLYVSHSNSTITVQPTCLNCDHEYEPEVIKLSDTAFDESASEVGEHIVATVQGKNYYYIDMLAKYNDDILTETDEYRIYSKVLSMPRMVIMNMSEKEIDEALEIHNNITESLTLSLTYREDIVCPGCSDSLKTMKLISPMDILSQVLNK